MSEIYPKIDYRDGKWFLIYADNGELEFSSKFELEDYLDYIGTVYKTVNFVAEELNLKSLLKKYKDSLLYYGGNICLHDGMWCFYREDTKILFTWKHELETFLDNLHLFYKDKQCQKMKHNHY